MYRFVKRELVRWRFERRNIYFKGNFKIGKGVEINTKYGGKIVFGENIELGDYTKFITFGGDISIGDYCSFNPFCVIYGHGGLEVGNKVRVATQTVIIPANHSYKDLEISIMHQKESRKGIVIGSDVWIAAGARILDGVNIGNGVVVAAGSVVTKSFESNRVIGGVPAKVIKVRDGK
ncbi:acyltransferase [Luteibaculum oceani]|uniref:acyltransferase n=1 Tax=Luteibaculum oceani TaxID=1294296 RepID=UPI001CB9B77A|nr:acyltransferase [Luteibaculum oceani]